MNDVTVKSSFQPPDPRQEESCTIFAGESILLKWCESFKILFMERLDYSVLDNPLLLQSIFFPRSDWSPAPEGASDHYVTVEEDVSVFCRFYPVSIKGPSFLYFHGNGEVVCDHDWISHLYNAIGVNLFVVDYRGYGPSGGSPTFSNTATDAHIVFDHVAKMLGAEGYTGSLYVMGRSLGSQSAMELAAHHPDEFKGLILESGFLQSGRLLGSLGLPIEIPNLAEFEASSLEQVGGITMPTLIIHGEQDTLIPHIEADTIYEHIGTSEKELLTIKGGGHNDILLVGMDQYFNAIKDFIQ